MVCYSGVYGGDEDAPKSNVTGSFVQGVASVWDRNATPARTDHKGADQASCGKCSQTISITTSAAAPVKSASNLGAVRSTIDFRSISIWRFLFSGLFGLCSTICHHL